MPGRKLSPNVRQCILRVKCLLLDVDGVLTDGKVYLGAGGDEVKVFDLRDGSGIKLAQMAGLKVGFISGRPSAATARRAKELAVDWLIQGAREKGRTVTELGQKTGFSLEQICFVGDDILDLPALKIVGFPVTVADAALDAKGAARYVTHANGGNGAVREVVELIVRTQGLWQNAIEAYWKQSSSPRQ
jgi:3-deoxy-D-manno-octulosonate 8-phosphate phosphatase (KDO 8-P phosphatase)